MRGLSRHASSTTSKAILYLLSAAAVLLFAGCASEGTLDPQVVGFELSVTPAQMNAVPGERCVLLVTLDPSLHGSSRAPVEISGSCPGAEVSVEHALLKPGEVAEVTVIPGAELPAGQDPNLDYFLAPTIRGARGGIAHHRARRPDRPAVLHRRHRRASGDRARAFHPLAGAGPSRAGHHRWHRVDGDDAGAGAGRRPLLVLLGRMGDARGMARDDCAIRLDADRAEAAVHGDAPRDRLRDQLALGGPGAGSIAITPNGWLWR